MSVPSRNNPMPPTRSSSANRTHDLGSHDPNAPQQPLSARGSDRRSETQSFDSANPELENEPEQEARSRNASTSTTIDEDELRRRHYSHSTSAHTDDDTAHKDGNDHSAFERGFIAGQKANQNQETPSYQEPKNKKNWFQRHPIATGAMIVGLACMYPVGTAIVAAGLAIGATAVVAYGTWKAGKALVGGIKSFFSKKSGQSEIPQDDNIQSKQRTRDFTEHSTGSDQQEHHMDAPTAQHSKEVQRVVEAAQGSIKIGDTHHSIPRSNSYTSQTNQRR